jgi:hypothetical protein
MVKWGKTQRSLAYQLIAKLVSQPLIQNNVAVSVSADNGEAARRHLEDAYMRIIEARKHNTEDPAVYVNGVRLTDKPLYDANGKWLTNEQLTIEHQPSTRDPPPGTDAAQPGTADARRATPDISSDSKSATSGSPFDGSVAATGQDAGKKTENKYSRTFSSVPGMCAGGALDGSVDNRSTTQKFLDWSGHGKPP